MVYCACVGKIEKSRINALGGERDIVDFLGMVGFIQMDDSPIEWVLGCCHS